MDVGAEHLEVMVSQAPRDSNCGHHPSLENSKIERKLQATSSPPPFPAENGGIGTATKRAGNPQFSNGRWEVIPAQLLPQHLTFLPSP